MKVNRLDVLVYGPTFGAIALFAYLVGTGRHSTVSGLLVLGVAAWVIFAAPLRVVVWVAGAGALVAPTTWPVIASAAGVDLYVGDGLLLVAGVAALVRRKRGLWLGMLGLVAAIFALVLVRSDLVGVIAFGRIIAPVVVLLLVAWVTPRGYDFWRDFRWGAVVVLASIPLTDGLAASRWTSIAGGPNETALIAAVALVLGFTHKASLWRYGLILAGAAALVGTSGIAGTVGAVAGVIVYSVSSRGLHLGKGSPIVALWLILTAVFVVPLVRPDMATSVAAHVFQARAFVEIVLGGDPFFGAGWANVHVSAFTGSDILGLHNVYLDVMAFTGLIGSLVFAAILVVTWRQGDVVARSVLAVWLVWVNTTGAFPGVTWGVLGLILAAVACTRSDQVAEERDDQALRGAGRRRVDADLDHAASGR